MVFSTQETKVCVLLLQVSQDHLLSELGLHKNNIASTFSALTTTTAISI
jgi:hypothetical protein